DRQELALELELIVGSGNVLWQQYDLMLYEYDGSIDKARPRAVVFPTTTQQVADVVKLCSSRGVAYLARGAGTGLSGGAIPIEGGVLIVFSKLDRILAVDVDNLRAVVEPGEVNLHLSQAVAHAGLHFVPDPS